MPRCFPPAKQCLLREYKLLRPLRFFLIPTLAVAVTVLVVWYAHLPSPLAEADRSQVKQAAEAGGYRLIDLESLSRLYRSDLENILLIDTRQEWEHRTGHIARSVNFPMEPTWWDRWKKRGRLKALLGPDKEKALVFY